MNKKPFILFILFAFVGVLSCRKIMPASPDNDAILDGHLDGLTTAQLKQFLAGDVAFNNQVFTEETGLGPVFVATSCGSCHAGDGKGHPFTTLTRYGQYDSTGNQYLAMGGPQLQNRALPGYNPETIPAGATFSKFTPPANTGLGFLELVPDDDILAMADPNDANADDISGIPNWKPLPAYLSPHAGAIAQNGKYIHRFGKKAAAYNLLHQTVNAYNQDMGITSVFEPKDAYSGKDIDPEIAIQAVNDVVFYLQTLKAPIQRNPGDAEVMHGKELFISSGCESCHKQTLKTGYSPVEALSHKEFHPYTDLLLHDMGAALNDNYTEGSATAAEWRTPPLWGLGLSPNSQGGQYFLMHDGRSKTIEDAILQHGGEANSSKAKFQNLSQADKDAMIKFLKSL
jgi:CxxC motif-containing protein (DUF1111 family)